MKKIKYLFFRIKWTLEAVNAWIEDSVLRLLGENPNDEFFVEANRCNNCSRSYLSPSEKYELVVTSYKTKEGCWNYSLGEVYSVNGTEKKLIDSVKRNYSAFPFAWVEEHANGHDYLLCGEDYQGQTVIELDTGKRKNYLPLDAYKGVGFCWADINPAPNKNALAVVGCYWACPYEIVLYDFSEPMSLPYKELGRVDDNGSDSFKWLNDNEAELTGTRLRRKSDGKDENDLENDEAEKMFNEKDYEEYKVKTVVKLR